MNSAKLDEIVEGKRKRVMSMDGVLSVVSKEMLSKGSKQLPKSKIIKKQKLNLKGRPQNP